ncbi:MAG: hypothetical protein ACTS6H_02045 [Candidatus Hodgkinia cicadicola]
MVITTKDVDGERIKWNLWISERNGIKSPNESDLCWQILVSFGKRKLVFLKLSYVGGKTFGC